MGEELNEVPSSQENKQIWVPRIKFVDLNIMLVSRLAKRED